VGKSIRARWEGQEKQARELEEELEEELEAFERYQER
jgi:hypothetical protein